MVRPSLLSTCFVVWHTVFEISPITCINLRGFFFKFQEGKDQEEHKIGE